MKTPIGRLPTGWQLLLMTLILGACNPGAGTGGSVATPAAGSPATEAPATASPSTAAAERKIDLKVYFLVDDPSGRSNPTLVPVRRQVDETSAVATAAVRELIAGPTRDEAAGVYGGRVEPVGRLASAVPAKTSLLGVTIQSGLATVDLSREFESGGGSFSIGARLAQVVYTLTQFPTVQRVNFRLDGRPVRVFSAEGIVLEGPATRSQFVDYLPSIFVDEPAWGAAVKDTLRVAGKANVFEAAFLADLVNADTGAVLARQRVMASCGTGCWGDFEIRFAVPSEARNSSLLLRVWSGSARDGSPENVREYPLG